MAICEECGIEYDQYSIKQKFCSRRCQVHARVKLDRERKGLIEIIGVCPVCGKEFRTRDKRKIYCDYSCNEAAHLAKAKEQRRNKKDGK